MPSPVVQVAFQLFNGVFCWAEVFSAAYAKKKKFLMLYCNSIGFYSLYKAVENHHRVSNKHCDHFCVPTSYLKERQMTSFCLPKYIRKLSTPLGGRTEFKPSGKRDVHVASIFFCLSECLLFFCCHTHQLFRVLKLHFLFQPSQVLHWRAPSWPHAVSFS